MLEMLPYPSGEPHIGHLKNYSVGDAVAHFRRRQGCRVLHPMGYDAFGLPAENHAISTGQHPRDSTERGRSPPSASSSASGGSRSTGRASSRTHEPRYYRWTQWIFLKLFERGLAYRTRGRGQVVPQRPDGAGQRAGHRRALRALRHEVEVRQLEQWFFRITDYADRLLDDLDDDRAGRRTSRRCSATGSGARRAPRSRSATRSWASTTPSSRRARTRCSARRSSSWRPSTPTSSGWPRGPSRSRRSTTTSTTC